MEKIKLLASDDGVAEPSKKELFQFLEESCDYIKMIAFAQVASFEYEEKRLAEIGVENVEEGEGGGAGGAGADGGDRGGAARRPPATGEPKKKLPKTNGAKK